MRTSTEPTTKATVTRFPVFGVLLGALIPVVECWGIVGFGKINGFFFSTDLLVAAAVLVTLLGALDLLLQIPLPGMGVKLLLRAALIVGIGYGLFRIVQSQLSLELLCTAAGWTLAQIYFASLWGRFLPFRWVAFVPTAAIVFRLFIFATPTPPTATVPPLRSDPTSGPSFLVVVLDTVRADHTSTYGYARATTPALDSLAKRGTRFEHAYSTASWTMPAHASLFTGLLPEQHGAHREHMALKRDIPTLAGLLTINGYETAAFSASPHVSAQTGMTRGFQHVEEFWQPFVVREVLAGCRIYRRLWPRDRDKGGAKLVARVVEWLEERESSRPYFVFVNLFEAHAPYNVVPVCSRRAFAPPDVSLYRLDRVGTLGALAQSDGLPFPRESGELLADLLDGAISAADAYLSQLIDAAGNDVVLIVLSDHGDLIGEHDFHGHGLELWEPLIQIPMVMAGPDIPRGKVAEEPVSIMDVMPTILGMANVTAPNLPGVDLRNVIGGDPTRGRILYAQQFRTAGPIASGWEKHRSSAIIARLRARKTAAIQRRWKRIITEDGTDFTFDLMSDPAELRPLQSSDVAVNLRLPRLTVQRQSGQDLLDPGTLAALRALGYIQ